MSLFGSALSDPGDMFMASYMRQMRQMNSMMNTMFADPFGMMGDMGMLMGPSHNSLMPYMPDGMMNMNRMMNDGMMTNRCNSFSSSTVVMSNGPDGRPMVYSSTSSTKVGPNGIKETRETVEDSRTGLKKMSIGHHIHDRAHVIEREQNYRSGDMEERQEFINIEEEEADEFNREFEEKARVNRNASHSRGRIMPTPQRQSPLLALPAPPTSNGSRPSKKNEGSRRQSRQNSSTPSSRYSRRKHYY